MRYQACLEGQQKKQAGNQKQEQAKKTDFKPKMEGDFEINQEFTQLNKFQQQQ